MAQGGHPRPAVQTRPKVCTLYCAFHGQDPAACQPQLIYHSVSSSRANRILGKKKDNILDSQSQIYEKGVQIELIESILFMLLKKKKKKKETNSKLCFC